MSVSARGRPRGEIVHALNCDQTAHALGGVGWQGGNWLLMSRVNLLGSGTISGFDDRSFSAVGPARHHFVALVRIARTEAFLPRVGSA
ncbi:hypothetical protein SPHV1_2400044 [Novosphingobium sp. KN65.2]|nr:hypothetical protein SPHV1_2400044 [Novosphingobium sp. KN65.2]